MFEKNNFPFIHSTLSDFWNRTVIGWVYLLYAKRAGQKSTREVYRRGGETKTKKRSKRSFLQ